MLLSSVVAIALLSTVNAVALIALSRQIGLLNTRVRPARALSIDESLASGDLIRLQQDPWALAHENADLIFLGFFSPTCSICATLIDSLQAIDRSSSADSVVLVTDASAEQARAYLEKRRCSLPFISDTHAFTANRVEGAPFGIVIDRHLAVVASGVTNTLEQAEWLIDTGRAAQVTVVEPDDIELEVVRVN